MIFMSKNKTHSTSEESRANTAARANAEALNQLRAKSVLLPELSASIVVTAYAQVNCLDHVAVMEQLRQQNANLALGNLTQAENMLMCQAEALQMIFANLAGRAISCKSAEQMQGILALALRAQSGCRATLQTLGELKNPRHAMFVKQANIAHGPQQVNNGAGLARTKEEIPVSTNKLSGANHELLEDTRAASPAITGYPVVAAVGKVHRAKVRSG